MPDVVAHSPLAQNELEVKTWQLFLLLVLANLTLAWFYNQHVLTREVFHNIFAERLEASRIDEYFDFTRKLSIWGYIMQPFFLMIQITFFALLLQTPLVLMLIEIPFAKIFRLIAIASVASTLASAMQLLRLSFFDAHEISSNVLDLMPFSLAGFIDPSEYPKSALFVLGKFNLFEVLWSLILYKGLATTGQIKKEQAAILVTLFWLALLLFQWGVVAYFEGVSS